VSQTKTFIKTLLEFVKLITGRKTSEAFQEKDCRSLAIQKFILSQSHSNNEILVCQLTFRQIKKSKEAGSPVGQVYRLVLLAA
jgi:hypothetical protein